MANDKPKKVKPNSDKRAMEKRLDGIAEKIRGTGISCNRTSLTIAVFKGLVDRDIAFLYDQNREKGGKNIEDVFPVEAEE